MQYLDSSGKTVSTKEAARLMGIPERTLRDHILKGKLRASNAESVLGGGAEGTVYRIAVDDLPMSAQIAYWQQDAMAELGHGGQEFDLIGYRERHGEDGLAELRYRQRAALAAHGLRREYDEGGKRGYTKALATLAEALGIPRSTLNRWERNYAANGLAGLARKEREDAGQSRSACLLARDYLEFLMCDQNKLTQNYALEKLQKLADKLGPDACERCPYRRASEERNAEIAAGHQLPLCDEAGNGLIAPENRYAVNRIMKQVPESVLAYGRYGSRYWDANFLQKAVRKKPELINEVWFGDHHQLNLFVVDRDGRIIRPWLTAWMDAASSALVGWMLTLQPNSDTIAESFARAAVATRGTPFVGLPKIVYIDNGKDYRSTRFEGGQVSDYEVGRLNDDFCGQSMLEALGVGVKHATPYWAWSKPIERMFGTLDRRWMRDFPGWCGDEPSQRPQELARQIKRMMEAGEMLTFEAFAARFKTEVIDKYHGFRGEDGLTPMERYQRGERARHDDPSWATMAMLRSQTTERKVKPQGISLGKIHYQDPALAAYIGKDVMVHYQRGENLSVTITYKGRFVCEAERVDALGTVEQDAAKLDQLMAGKAEQRKAVKARMARIEQRVGGVVREAYAEEVDEVRDRSLARVDSTTARRAMAAKEAVARRAETRARRRAGVLDEADRRLEHHFQDMGRLVLRRAKEG